MRLGPSIHCSPQLWRDPDWRDLPDAYKGLFFESLPEAIKTGGRWPKALEERGLAVQFEAIRKRNITVTTEERIEEHGRYS